MSDFTWKPSTQSRGDPQVRWLTTQYGNGVEQRMADGPNNVLIPWTLRFTNITPAVVQEIHVFLKAKAQLAAAFTWTPLPPFDVTEGEVKVTCINWPFSYDAGGGIIGLTAEFKQVVR